MIVLPARRVWKSPGEGKLLVLHALGNLLSGEAHDTPWREGMQGGRHRGVRNEVGYALIGMAGSEAI